MKLNNPAPTTKAPAERFTGDVYLQPLHAGEAPSKLIAAMVHFTPGARTNWHSHPLGQTLHCTAGTEHENGQSATWLEPVSDADYATAHTQTAR